VGYKWVFFCFAAGTVSFYSICCISKFVASGQRKIGGKSKMTAISWKKTNFQPVALIMFYNGFGILWYSTVCI